MLTQSKIVLLILVRPKTLKYTIKVTIQVSFPDEKNYCCKKEDFSSVRFATDRCSCCSKVEALAGQ